MRLNDIQIFTIHEEVQQHFGGDAFGGDIDLYGPSLPRGYSRNYLGLRKPESIAK